MTSRGSVIAFVRVALTIVVIALTSVRVEIVEVGAHLQGYARWWVDFGDDASQWARDGECDDPPFEGSGMDWTLLVEDRGRDASDCRRLYEAGRIHLSGVDLVAGRVDFRDDGGEWARDGECDDPRFKGTGAADTLLLEDRERDASDCRQLYEAGRVRLWGLCTSPAIVSPTTPTSTRLAPVTSETGSLPSRRKAKLVMLESKSLRGRHHRRDRPHRCDGDPKLVVSIGRMG